MNLLPFEDVFKDESGGNIKILKTEFLKEGKIPIVDQGKGLIAGFTNDEKRICKSELPVIVFGDHTRCFKFIDFPFAMGADGVKVLKPKIQADEKFLYYYLKSLHLTDAGYDRHFKYLKRTEILIPPLPEQKQIAEVLDKADALREKRRLALQKLDALLQSVFLEMFGDPVRNPKGWKIVSLSQVTKINPRFINDDGLTSNSKVSFVPMTYVSEKSKTIVNEEERNLGDVIKGFTYFENNDVLLAKITPCFENGKIALANIKNKIGFGSTEFHVIRANETELDSKCLFYFLQRDQILFEGENRMTGSAGQKRVPKAFLENLKIPLPPMNEQKRISDLLSKASFIKEKYRSALVKMEILFQSLQQRAFKGELFSNNLASAESQEENVLRQGSLF